MLLRKSELLNQSRIGDGRSGAKAGKKGRQSIALEKRLLNSSGSDATGVPPREPSGASPSVSGEILEYEPCPADLPAFVRNGFCPKL